MTGDMFIYVFLPDIDEDVQADDHWGLFIWRALSSCFAEKLAAAKPSEEFLITFTTCWSLFITWIVHIAAVTFY